MKRYKIEAHRNHCFEMHLGYLGPVSCASHPESAQGALSRVASLAAFCFHSEFPQGSPSRLQCDCSMAAASFFFFFYWYDRQYFLFSAGKSYYSTLIMSLPCIFLFWLIKKFNIFICHPIAFWLLLFLMRSQLFILWGFSCMQITFFLLPKILSLAFSITILCLNVALSVLFSYLQFVELLRYVC